MTTNDIAIRARGLGKRYRRGQRHKSNSFREVLVDGAKSLFGSWSKTDDASPSPDFWALRNATFDIARGENVGIIGLNGAGKSTLLKILSRITTPTEGTGRVEGRLGALLEVGTGFHQELTGRENVFLYGSILGMSREEIARKFDAIVAFSEIADFIDTPVKRYSSGMYVRLAFSVAAHLDPDILLLDEVLAVGDFTFQRKCIDFAHELERKGATILFVSHNMFSIKSMCQRVIYLRHGEVVFDGPTDDGLKLYEADCRLAVAPWFHPDPDAPAIDITDIELIGEGGERKQMFDFGERMTIRVHYDAKDPIKDPDIRIGINRSDEVHCSTFSSVADDVGLSVLSGPGEIELTTPPIKLVSDLYTLTIAVREKKFGRLVVARIGETFHVRHPIFASNAFGVMHERGEWQHSGAKVVGKIGPQRCA
ncbi:ABC transporter ATP-binding protein [Hyphomicrobium sp. MC1]|uniref:ABC transporter ATP-binding protein n=1 Tax=Hyphomicrobium sp. (strain MC1) TaxID=717785 RepID=UPI000213ED6E|nr:ABC transporter ATP-binding protein [Hyphomicrobium sp. MC1]CCB66032.1 ABC transporter related [Hyphomicrobium sp. MC1]